MQKVWSVIGLAVLVIGVGVALALGVFNKSESTEPNGSVSNAEDAAIRAQVVAFGGELQKVSLLAPQPERKAAMDEHYAAYVAPALLAQWYPEEAEEALGRTTSSPWPDRIEVVAVTQNGDTATVEGNIIEVANGQDSTKEAAAIQPVTLVLKKIDGQWLITDSTKGAYAELPKRQTMVGTWECLPHKDTTGPQTMECAFGIAVTKDSHYAIDTSLMSTYPVDFPTGTKVQVSGIVTPVEMLSSVQKYDIDGIIRATEITKI